MAKEDSAKAGVDFEYVNSNAKDSKGNPVKTRRFFSRAEKAAMKDGKKPEAKAEKAPTKAAPKTDKGMDTSPRPKARPKAEAKAGGARPEGKAAGMPAAKKAAEKKNVPSRADASKKAAVAGVGAVAAMSAGAAARKNNIAARGGVKPSASTGLFSRIKTGLGRASGVTPHGVGGARARSAIDKAKDPLMLMSKGGMVKKGRK